MMDCFTGNDFSHDRRMNSEHFRLRFIPSVCQPLNGRGRNEINFVRKKRDTRRQKIRRTLYRIQGILGMTERESRMFMMLAFLVLIGSLAQHYYETRPVENSEAFAQFDAEFNRLTKRADSLDQIRKLIDKDFFGPDDVRRITPNDDSLSTSRIDINRATSEELQQLPRIGPALARQILMMRTRLGEFLSTDDLMLVSGIGEKTLDRLRPLIVATKADTLQ